MTIPTIRFLDCCLWSRRGGTLLLKTCWSVGFPTCLWAAVCTAERVAYRNGANGLLPPETATTCNPYREWIGAQIRADFFGYACPGQPEKAAALAFRDAAISHVKNGIYGEMWIAAMLAEAAITDDLFQVLKAGLGQIPSSCRLQEDIQRVICWKQEGISLEEATLRIHQQWKETNGHHWCHTNSNAMIVVMALLWGDMDIWGKLSVPQCRLALIQTATALPPVRFLV